MERKYYRISPRLAYCAAFTIILSFIAHVATAILLKTYIFRTNNGLNQATHDQFPPRPRPAAIVITNSTRYGLYDDDEWASLTPQGRGFVRHPSHEEYFSISLYHQIHCLNALRGLIKDRNELSDLRVGHANHCLNFLRQMLLCNADTTLEPTTQTVVQEKHVNVVTGIGVTHQCRDWAQVREFAEANYRQYQKKEKTVGEILKPSN